MCCGGLVGFLGAEEVVSAVGLWEGEGEGEGDWGFCI